MKGIQRALSKYKQGSGYEKEEKLIFKNKGFQLCMAFALGIIVLLLPRPEGTKFRIIGDEGQKLLQHVDRYFILVSPDKDQSEGYTISSGKGRGIVFLRRWQVIVCH